MGNVTIFESQSALPVVRRQSRLADKMGTGGGGLRRIQTATNGTFRRIVGGEKIGKSATGAIDVIIVDMLSDVSRQFYAAKYDPDAPPTLPDCWSNMGVKPEAAASNKQASACNSCPKNVEGSGSNGKGRACRFLRRLAVLIVGDPSGEVYQLNVPAASLFSKGVGNIHGFESYKNFLRANGEGVDTVVTRVMYDSEADTMKLKFQPIRQLTAEEDALVTAAQEDPETERYTKLTAAEADGVTKTAPATPAVTAAVAPAPTSNLFSDDEDEDEDEGEAPVQVKEPEPKKRASKKAEAPATQAKPELNSVLSSWLDDDADGDDAPF
jgi:hypothetical protein